VALPTSADLKAYLRIETTAEDALLAALLVRARAMLETWIDVPIIAEVQTAEDDASALARPVRALVFPRRPMVVTAIVDSRGETVPPVNYRGSVTSGIIYALNDTTFQYGPYTMSALVGLSLRQDYGRLEPVVSAAIIDLAADLYQRRTPGASSETAAGTAISWDASRETVARIMKTMRSLRLGVGL
jgi:hypothetical protein